MIPTKVWFKTKSAIIQKVNVKLNLHLCASSLSSESPHFSASSGVGLQIKAERFFNKPISARFLIVWPIRGTSSSKICRMDEWGEKKAQNKTWKWVNSSPSFASLFHASLCLLVFPHTCGSASWMPTNTESLSASAWWGEGFYNPTECELEGGRGGAPDGQWGVCCRVERPPPATSVCLPPAACHPLCALLWKRGSSQRFSRARCYPQLKPQLTSPAVATFRTRTNRCCMYVLKSLLSFLKVQYVVLWRKSKSE